MVGSLKAFLEFVPALNCGIASDGRVTLLVRKSFKLAFNYVVYGILETKLLPQCVVAYGSELCYHVAIKRCGN